MRLTTDTETIPTQSQLIVQELQAPIIEARDAELATIAPPSNWKDPEKLAEWWATTGKAKRAEVFFKAEQALEDAVRKTALDSALGQLAVICLQVEDQPAIELFDGGDSYAQPGYEAWLLNEFDRTLKQVCGHHLGHQLIGHHLAFDRSFLRHRSIINGIQPHPMLIDAVKPWDLADGKGKFVDTMILWTGDAHTRIKLDKLCQVLGIERKGSELEGEEIDGSKVWDFVQRGEIHKVARYCAADCMRTYRCLTRMLAPSAPALAYLTLAERQSRAAAAAMAESC
jgi:hypothetical protein